MAVPLGRLSRLGCAAALTAWLPLASGVVLCASASPVLAPTAVKSVSVAGVPDAIAIDSVTDTAYVALRGQPTPTGTVAVINVASGKVTATIPVGTDPSQIAVNAAANVIYVLNSQSGSVSVISGATDSIVTTLTGLASGSKAVSGLAVDTATDMAYVAIAGIGSAGKIDEIDGATNTVTGTITGTGLSTGIAINPTTDTAYVPNEPGSGQPPAAAVVDLASSTITSTIPLSGQPRQIAVDPDTNTVYTTSWQDALLTAYSGATNTETGSLYLGGAPVGIAVNPHTDTVYAALDTSAIGDVNVSLINGAATAITGTIPMTLPVWVAIDPTTDTLAVTQDSTVLLVTLTPPAITSTGHVTFTAGTSASFTVHADGTPAATFTESGKLPPGITLTSTGTLRGTPGAHAGGIYRFTTIAANGVAPAATRAFILTVDQPAVFTSFRHATFTAGTRHSFTIRTTGYPAAIVTKIGKLPRGLRFVAHANGTAAIRGIAARSARGRTFIIRLHASNGTRHPADQLLTLRVR